MKKWQNLFILLELVDTFGNDQLKKMPPRGLPLGGLTGIFNFRWDGFKPVYLTCRTVGFSLRGVPPH